jgi:hypothetical protein
MSSSGSQYYDNQSRNSSRRPTTPTQTRANEADEIFVCDICKVACKSSHSQHHISSYIHRSLLFRKYLNLKENLEELQNDIKVPLPKHAQQTTTATGYPCSDVPQDHLRPSIGIKHDTLIYSFLFQTLPTLQTAQQSHLTPGTDDPIVVYNQYINAPVYTGRNGGEILNSFKGILHCKAQLEQVLNHYNLTLDDNVKKIVNIIQKSPPPHLIDNPYGVPTFFNNKNDGIITTKDGLIHRMNQTDPKYQLCLPQIPSSDTGSINPDFEWDYEPPLSIRQLAVGVRAKIPYLPLGALPKHMVVENRFGIPVNLMTNEQYLSYPILQNKVPNGMVTIDENNNPTYSDGSVVSYDQSGNGLNPNLGSICPKLPSLLDDQREGYLLSPVDCTHHDLDFIPKSFYPYSQQHLQDFLSKNPHGRRHITNENYKIYDQESVMLSQMAGVAIQQQFIAMPIESQFEFFLKLKKLKTEWNSQQFQKPLAEPQLNMLLDTSIVDTSAINEVLHNLNGVSFVSEICKNGQNISFFDDFFQTPVAQYLFDNFSNLAPPTNPPQQQLIEQEHWKRELLPLLLAFLFQNENGVGDCNDPNNEYNDPQVLTLTHVHQQFLPLLQSIVNTVTGLDNGLGRFYHYHNYLASLAANSSNSNAKTTQTTEKRPKKGKRMSNTNPNINNPTQNNPQYSYPRQTQQFEQETSQF